MYKRLAQEQGYALIRLDHPIAGSDGDWEIVHLSRLRLLSRLSVYEQLSLIEEE